MVFSSLSKEFAGFRAAYNLGSKKLSLTQLMKELQPYEIMLNDGKAITGEAKFVSAKYSKGKKKQGKITTIYWKDSQMAQR